MSEFIKTQAEARANLIAQMRDVIDTAELEKRGLTAEDTQKIERIEADIEQRDAAIATAQKVAEREERDDADGGRFVVVIEDGADADAADTLTRITRIEQVIATSLVYEYSGPDAPAPDAMVPDAGPVDGPPFCPVPPDGGTDLWTCFGSWPACNGYDTPGWDPCRPARLRRDDNAAGDPRVRDQDRAGHAGRLVGRTRQLRRATSEMSA